MAGAPLTLTTLPTEFANKVFTRAQSGSALAKVFNATPQKFSNQGFHVLSAPPKAQFVGAGAAKAASNPKLDQIVVPPVKAQVTMRFDEEVQWADEDYQMGILDQLALMGGNALARALDLGAIHGVSPLEGTRFTPIQNPAVNSTTSVEIAAGKEYDAIGAAVGALQGTGLNPGAMVFDPKYTFAVSQMTNPQTGQQLHAQFGPFGMSAPGDTDGIRSAVSDTVSGVNELAADSKLRGLMIADNNFVWGVQKDLGLKKFETGDPDNTGMDLAGHNQIALRLELVYSFAFIDLKGVAKIVDAVA